jgi:malate dehydrogenase (oxaloacetate-decarboxylating)(NADP+)
MLWESPAVAEAAMDTGIARIKVDLDDYRQQLTFRQGMGQQIRYYIMNKAKSAPTKKGLYLRRGRKPKLFGLLLKLRTKELLCLFFSVDLMLSGKRLRPWAWNMTR